MTRRALWGIPLLTAACGDDNEEADVLGVGAERTMTAECDERIELTCLPEFKGGYCGVRDCTGDMDCPEASACVAHTDGVNHCFRTCVDKPERNENGAVENEANCSSSVDFVDGAQGRKACVPPSSGI
jgi:hypothetical protein